MPLQKKILQTLWKGIKSFGLFWKNFLIGDAPEIALGVVLILGIAFASRGSVLIAGASIIVLVVLLMAFTVWRHARK